MCENKREKERAQREAPQIEKAFCSGAVRAVKNAKSCEFSKRLKPELIFTPFRPLYEYGRSWETNCIAKQQTQKHTQPFRPF